MDRIVHCQNCSKLLTGKIVWLELDQRVNEYTEDKIAKEYSQGAFPFGLSCSKIMLLRYKTVLFPTT